MDHPVRTVSTHSGAHRPGARAPSAFGLRALCLAGAVHACLLGCDSPPEQSRPRKLRAADDAGQEPVRYAPGRWRLAAFDVLDHSVLWLAHILIRYEQNEPANNLFPALGWLADAPAPTRTRRDALQLAQRVAQQAALDPSQFAFLARSHSDDISTRDRGGSLGGTRASQLPPPMLDALQATRLGHVTEVVETVLGFHIVKWSPPPVPAQVAGEHVVIRYDGTANSEVLGTPGRTRAQALALAHEIAASKKPFPALVAAYSEHPSRGRHGDLGVWSSIAPLHNGRELETLAGLALGEVSAPMDTPQGFQIIKRVEVTPRQHYAATWIQIRYSAPDDADSKASARQLANALAVRLRANPEQFAALQEQQKCCADEVVQWTRGTTYDEALESSVSRLAIGEIAREPVDLGWYYLIPKRLDPALLPETPRLSYELPAPSAPDAEHILRNTQPDILIGELRALKAEFLRKVPLEKREAATIDKLLSELETALRQARKPEDRAAARQRTRHALQENLDRETFAAFERFRDAWLTIKVMGASAR